MRHLSHDAGLQSDEVAGKDEAPDLRAAIKRRLLAQVHATQSSEQLQIVGPFDQQRRSSFNDPLTDLEILHHLDVLIGNRLENGVSAQRTFAAWGRQWSSLSGCLVKMTRHRKTGSARASGRDLYELDDRVSNDRRDPSAPPVVFQTLSVSVDEKNIACATAERTCSSV